MWRGKSDDDKNDGQGRSGGDQPRARGNSRPGQRGGERSRPGSLDPRNQNAGKKIRRIESGQADPGPGSRRRAPSSGRPLAARSGRPGEATDIGRPPSGPPRRSQAGGPGLPPLTQPTGEIPKIPDSASPDDTVVVSSPKSPEPPFRADSPFASDAPSPAGMAMPSAMPSALPSVGDTAGRVSDATGVMPALNSDRQPGAAVGSVPRQTAEAGLGAMEEHVPTDPFPDALADMADRPVGPAPQTRAFDSASVAAAATGGAPVDARAADRPGRDPQPSPFDSSADLGRPIQQRRGAAGPPAGAGRPGRGGFEAKPSGRLQDTELKLADKRRKQKPKEPNRLVLGLALGLVVLVGVAVAFLLSRGGDDTQVADAPEGETEVPVTEPEPLSDSTTPEQPVADPEPQVNEPTLFFDAAQTGPLLQGQTYSIDLVGEPEGSMLQVVVDGIAQGAPDLALPDLILPGGRHSLYIEISIGAEVSTSTPIEVFVLGDEPLAGYRANLSSVDKQTEGWAEAIRQFDEFRAAGHEGLQMWPITDGFWNIFVGGFGEDSAAALAYCESFGLVVPDQCFAPLYEAGSAPVGDQTTESTVAESMEDTSTTVEAMEDGSQESTTTTAAGG